MNNPISNKIASIACAVVMGASSAAAQSADSEFASYEAYASYVDQQLTQRNFIPFIQKMGGRDEYTIEQLKGVNRQLTSIFPANFTSRTLFLEEDLGGDIRREARAYWSERAGYLFFYAILHERRDKVVVLNFAVNTKLEKILAKF